MAMKWREIEARAEEAAPPMPGGMMKWAKNPESKKKYHKALGIQHGFILGSFRGDSGDFDDFLKEALYKAHDYGFLMRYGKNIFRDHMRLRKQMDEDFFEGVKLGELQASNGTDFYLEHRKTW